MALPCIVLIHNQDSVVKTVTGLLGAASGTLKCFPTMRKAADWMKSTKDEVGLVLTQHSLPRDLDALPGLVGSLLKGEAVPERQPEIGIEGRGLGSAIHNSSISVVMVDPEHKIRYANTHFKSQMGYNSEDIQGLAIDLAGIPDSDPDEYKDCHQALKKGLSWHGTLFQKRINGSTFWERAAISPVNGLLVKMSDDITFSRLRNQEMLLVKSQMDSLLSTLDDVVWSIMLPHNRLIFINKAMETHFGYPPERFFQDSHFYQSLVHPDHLEAYLEAQDQLLDLGTLNMEYRIRHGKGHWVWIHDRAWVIKDEKGQPWRLDGILSDITERHQFLEQLMEAKNAAETANEGKARFLATVTHEIRTPLNSIIGSADLLLQTPLDENQEELSHLLKRGGTHLLDLVNDVLDVTKMEAGKMELEELEFDLRELVTTSLQMIRAMAQQKGIDLVLELSPLLPSLVVGDPHRLRQILGNLLGNALKFTHLGYILLAVDPIESSEMDLNASLRILVKDTGIGIPREKFQTIFDPFTQGDNTITRKYGGSGLGLAICRQIVEMMRGQIHVESQLGQGTAFTVTLPFKTSLTPLSQGPAQTQGLRILAAEDNVINQRLLWALADQTGMRLTMVQNGQEFLDLVYGGLSFDLGLMDCEMPVLDGFQATGALRAWEAENPRTKPLTVIALTAHDPSAIEAKAREVGMNQILTKPLTAGSLQRAITKIFSPKTNVERFPSLDHSDLLTRMNHEAALIKIILEESVQLFPVMIQELKEAWNQKDSEGFLRVVHGLKGAFAGVSALELLHTAQELESLKIGSSEWTQPLESLMGVLDHQAWIFQDAAQNFLTETTYD